MAVDMDFFSISSEILQQLKTYDENNKKEK